MKFITVKLTILYCYFKCCFWFQLNWLSLVMHYLVGKTQRTSEMCHFCLLVLLWLSSCLSIRDFHLLPPSLWLPQAKDPGRPWSREAFNDNFSRVNSFFHCPSFLIMPSHCLHIITVEINLRSQEPYISTLVLSISLCGNMPHFDSLMQLGWNNSFIDFFILHTIYFT